MHRIVILALLATLLGLGSAGARADEPKRETELIDASAKLKEELKAKTAEIEQLKKEVERLRLENIKLVRQVAEFRHTAPVEPKTPELPPPPVADGIVLAVSPQGLVEISIGSDDGIQVGHELEVIREAQGQAKYLGRIVIRRTRPERAVGEILKDRAKGPIQANDRVMTKVEK